MLSRITLAVLIRRSGLPRQSCLRRLPPQASAMAAAASAARTLPSRRHHFNSTTVTRTETLEQSPPAEEAPPPPPPKGPAQIPPVAPPAPDASFAELGVAETLCKNLPNLNVAAPSDFQRSVIPRLIRGQTMIMTAETGSGKTLAYLLPLLTRYLGPDGRLPHEEEKMDPRSGRILILVPNRELSVQILRVLHPLTAGMGITATVFPPPPSVPLSELSNPDIVITTPAAVEAACKSSKLIDRFLARTQACIVDEADWIASDTVGLRVLRHVSRVSKKRNQRATIQFVFSAATLPPVLHKKSTTPREMIQRLFASIHKVSSKDVHSPPRGLAEEFLPVVPASSAPITLEKEDQVKCDALLALMLENTKKMAKDPSHTDNKWIVFCNDARRAKIVYASVVAAFESPKIQPPTASEIAVKCELLHGGQSTSDERSERVLEFVSAGTQQAGEPKTFHVLVSTDMVARGVDFQDVTTVMQVDFATDASAYLHRIGRTARIGKRGRAISFVTPPDMQLSDLIRDASIGITDSPKLQNPALNTHDDDDKKARGQGETSQDTVDRLPLTGVMSRNRSFSTKMKRRERRLQRRAEAAMMGWSRPPPRGGREKSSWQRDDNEESSMQRDDNEKSSWQRDDNEKPSQQRRGNQKSAWQVRGRVNKR
ncbi:hypothetical protein HDU86_007173 [Geranomyces michiganensis]|nr:hypothetical protein HDU86_007173 [Geranomyces michiganensis]